MRLLFDSHLDLAWNALSFDRDQTLSVKEIRRLEMHMTDEPCRGRATTSLPELREARAAVVVATLLARGGPDQKRKEAYLRSDLDFSTQSIAHATAHGQLSYYRLLEAEGQLWMALHLLDTCRAGLAQMMRWRRDGRQEVHSPSALSLRTASTPNSRPTSCLSAS